MQEIIKRHTKIVLASALCLILLAGCVQYYKIYGFKSTETNLSWGRVGARLHTTTDDHLFWVNFKSPYRLSIWFESDSLIEGTIQITELKLIDAQTKEVVVEKVQIHEKPFKKDMQIYDASFSIKDLKLAYVNMILQIKFSLKQGDIIREYDTELSLETDYNARFALTSH